jgi:drug/metabolite transporter (DMT)-like permease
MSVAVVTFGGFWLSLVAIAHLDVAIANTLTATESLFVLPLAAFLLKERITPPVVLGSLVTVGGIVLIVAPW